MCARSARQLAATGHPVDSGRRREAIDVVAFSIAIIVYVMLIPWTGFWLTSFVMLTVTSVFLSVRRNLRVAVVASLVAALLCVGAYLVFLRLFFVPLPAGWFGAFG